MANLETLSRPYAQALFEHSEGWSKDLDQIASIVSMPSVSNLIDSPHLSYQEKVDKFLSLLEGEVETKSVNFLKVLGESKRLSLIPDIANQYRLLVEAKEDKKTIELFSPHELSEEQVQKLSLSLKKQFGENLAIESQVDESLIGGFLAKCGDDVFDASIKGKLEKLRNQIT
jgi:F-type H+-transporting ATPase subunit delta